MSKATKPKPAPESVVDAQDKIPQIPAESFKVGDKEFRFAIAQFNIPGIGILTAAEALADNDPQEALEGKTVKEWLVSVGSGAVTEA